MPGNTNMTCPQQLSMVYALIRREHMLQRGDRVLVGVSGGADSVCLLLMLHDLRTELEISLEVAHLEHGIRGEESLADAAFVAAISGRLGLPCHIRHMDVPALAKRDHCSVEEAAREARYRFFAETAERRACGVIAVAHHQEDQAETVLLSLIRGAGVFGLGGMAPASKLPNKPALRLIRPLLETRRSRIESYLLQAGQSWRTDVTNEDPAFARNLIRHEVMPLLTSVNAGATEHLVKSAAFFREAASYLQRQTAEAAERCVKRNDQERLSIFLPDLRQEDPALHPYLLRHAICRILPQGARDVGEAHISMLQQLCMAQSGKCVNLPHHLLAQREGDWLLLSRMTDETEPRKPRTDRLSSAKEVWFLEREGENSKMLPDGTVCRMTYGIFDGDAGKIPQNVYTKWLACDTISDKLCLRTRRPGDYLVINVSGGRKKLKQYLIDEKIPASQRDGLWLLASGSHILWVIGHRISEAAKLQYAGQEMLCIHIIPVEKGMEYR